MSDEDDNAFKNLVFVVGGAVAMKLLYSYTKKRIVEQQLKAKIEDLADPGRRRNYSYQGLSFDQLFNPKGRK